MGTLAATAWASAGALPGGASLGMNEAELRASVGALERGSKPTRLVGGLAGLWSATSEICGRRVATTHLCSRAALDRVGDTDAAESGAKRQKPPQYLQWLFDLFTTPGDTIIDGFGGSGTSVLVAEKMGRRCICIERDPQSFGQIVERVRGAIEETVQEAA